MWVPIRQDVIDDGYGPGGPMARMIEGSLKSMLTDDPLTEQEEREGWRTTALRDGSPFRFAVGWRAVKLAWEEEARREAAMAVCPYVACICGHHED